MANRIIDIEDLPKLLSMILKPNVTIKDCITNPLIGPGENYGSILFSVTVVLENTISTEFSKLHLVAKTVPKEELNKKIFRTSITFKQEIAMYQTIIPALVKFQQDQGVTNTISFFPKYHGSRISLIAEATEVDDDAVLLLENLKVSGFDIIDRMKGFDLNSAQLILHDLAVLHAVPVAIKLIKPDIFNDKIRPHLISLLPFEPMVPDLAHHMIDNIIDAAKLSNECVPLIPRILKGIQYCKEYESSPLVEREPFATLTHNDFWVNNVMLKSKGKQPAEIKFLDFQFIDYNSPAIDVIFFIYTSVQSDVIDLHFDKLIRYYYQIFISTLKTLQCDTNLFSYDLFVQEIDIAAKNQFFHILRMLQPIFTPKGESINLSELNPETFKIKSDEYCKRLAYVILAFSKNTWI